ncbi:hypothetical protein LTR17_021210 [Elasticomyces elasticus]|nr:hypothetical protein LTR17_021210 [Elasticomyces elasticus]
MEVFSGIIPTWANSSKLTQRHKITREFLEAVFDADSPTVKNDCREDVIQFAEDLRERYKGTISSWDDVNPQEVRAALAIVNAQLSSEGIQDISPDVFRWRMLQTVRYLKRRPRPAIVDGSGSSSNVGPSLPPVSELLRRADADEF